MDAPFAQKIDASKCSPLTPKAPSITFAPHITDLQLTDFRSYTHIRVPCGAGGVVLTGDNGMGKTNILEAVSQFGTGRGLRSATLADMARIEGAGGWTLAAQLSTVGGSMQIGIGVDTDKQNRRLRIDGQSVQGFEMLNHYCPQLWLTPSMDRLFVDGATGRRKFLDRFAMGLMPFHNKALSNFEKAMRERNRLLQEGAWQNQAAWLEGLENTMSKTGVTIAETRLEALDVLSEALAQAYHRVFPQAKIALDGLLEAALRQNVAAQVEENYQQMLHRNRTLDARAGRTLEGPHRTDLVTQHLTKNMPAAKCSTGEQKALLVGLVLAQARVLALQTGTVPLLLLDEVTAHLDATRRRALFEVVHNLGAQAWVTGTDTGIFEQFTKTTHGAQALATHLHVTEGEVCVLNETDK